MTVLDAMKKYKKPESRTRVYVQELDTEIYRNLKAYYGSEVVNIYDHNGDMVCEVKAAQN